MISSVNNATVKATAKLRKRRERERRGAFLVEGRRAVTAALSSGATVTAVLHMPQARRHVELLDRAARSGAKISEVSEPVMAHLTELGHPPDVVAVVLHKPDPLDAAISGELCVVLAGIRDPGVAGGILAAAAGAGATGAIALESTTDLFAPACIRAGGGAHFVLPATEHVAPAEAAALLSDRAVFALAGGAGPVCSAGMRTPMALVVCENEVPPEFAAAVRLSVPTPAHGVGAGPVARAAIALHEATRGRA